MSDVYMKSDVNSQFLSNIIKLLTVCGYFTALDNFFLSYIYTGKIDLECVLACARSFLEEKLGEK